MEWDEFHDNVIGWAEERGIIPNAKPVAQMGKVLEEVAETWQAIVAEDEAEIKDGIGDVAVTIVIHAVLSNHMIANEPYNLDGPEINNLSRLEIVIESVIQRQHLAALMELMTLAEKLGYDFMECCELAWNEIKDRKGWLDEQGVFHKAVPGVVYCDIDESGKITRSEDIK